MNPHPIIKKHYTNNEEKTIFLNRLFNTSATHYDSVVSIGLWGKALNYRSNAIRRAGLKSGMRVLDIGCGTGLMSAAACDVMDNSGFIVAIDPSSGMLEQAESRVPEIKIQRGSAANTGQENSMYDFLMMGYALRHVEGLDLAFTEFFRVMKPGARFCILELTKPDRSIRGKFLRFCLKYVWPILTLLKTRSNSARKMMSYYWETIDAVVPPETVKEALRESGFRGVRRKLRYGICSEYVGYKPQN